MIEKLEFARTDHMSSRVIFGAAALGGMSQPRADATLETLLAYGVNHIDTASAYGASELRLAPFLKRHREAFFLATKTGDRTTQAARDSLHRSLERMQTDHVDLIQLHNLVDEEEWEQALAAGGALEALIDAREQGLVRFIGVTGHGSQVARMHLRSLERFAFDSVLLPCNFTMLCQPDYRRDFDQLISVCAERGVAVQTIKSIARRRWQDGDGSPHFSWYEPLRDPEAIGRAIGFVLSRPGLFLNSSSDATLLRATLDAASDLETAPVDSELAGDVTLHGIEPLFVPEGPQGVSNA